MKTVVTAFEPFGGKQINKSLETVNNLKGYTVYTLPVSWNKIKPALEKIIKEENPDVLVLTGEAGPYKEIKIELEAHNISCGTDNDGMKKENEPIDPIGIDTLKTGLTFDKTLSCQSADAGKYLCNYSYYISLEMMKGNALFIHFPAVSDAAFNAATLLNIIKTIKK